MELTSEMLLDNELVLISSNSLSGLRLIGGTVTKSLALDCFRALENGRLASETLDTAVAFTYETIGTVWVTHRGTEGYVIACVSMLIKPKA